MTGPRCVGVALFLSLCTAPSLRAQAVDSVTVGASSRYLWRGYELAGGAVVRSSVSFALAGFAATHRVGERQSVTFDVLGWNVVEQRATRRAADQYQASLGYSRCVDMCDELTWARRTTLTVNASEYWQPDAVGNRTTEEVELSLRRFDRIERAGERQLGINLSSFVTVDHDFSRFTGSYVRGGTGSYLGPFGNFGATLDAAVSFSDWRSRAGADRTFSYHAVDLALGVDHDRRFGNRRHLSTRLTLGTELPARDIGAVTGVVGLRFKVSGPVYRFR